MLGNLFFIVLLPCVFSTDLEAFMSLRNTTSIRDQIVETVFANYESQSWPGSLTREITNVTVEISIQAITSVDVRNMEYTLDMLLRQSWKDQRLAWDHYDRFRHYNKNIVSPKFKQDMWLPDLFFRNGKKGRRHTMTCENLLIRIQPDGTILYSQKLTMKLACQMDLQTFPMDTQHCHMNIGSYGYTLDQVRFNWIHDKIPVTLPNDLQISEFDPPREVVALDCTEGSTTSTGSYTCLNATFVLSRQLGSWLASTYVPSVLIMMVSWLNFWVSLDAVPARVNLGLLTLLGVITQSTSVASSLPRVSYIKAIDVWTIACIAFNSGVLLEFAIASNLAKRKRIADWHVEVRKTVRQELARWCTACQQQCFQRGPAAINAYSNMEGGKQFGYAGVAAAAALAMQNTNPDTSNSKTTIRLTSAGLEHNAVCKVVPADHHRQCRQDGRSETPGELAEPNVNDALLNKPNKPPKPAPVSDIDSYSRFLFPACFLLYNCFYWLYYLVIVNQ